MKVTINQPHVTEFSELAIGKMFLYEFGVYIKTAATDAVCLHCIAGLMRQEGLAKVMSPGSKVTRVVEASFTVG